MEKLSKAEERVYGAATHLFDCEKMVHDSEVSGPELLAYQGEYDRAVKILRAAIAMHHFEFMQQVAEKAVKEKDGLIQ